MAPKKAAAEAGAAGEAKPRANASQVLERFLAGELTAATAVPQLRHMMAEDAEALVDAFCEKLQFVVSNADIGMSAARAGLLLANTAITLDKPPQAQDKKGGAGVPATAGSPLCKHLVERLLALSGGPGQAPKEKTVRAQCCGLLAVLSAAVPGHQAAEAKLIEFSRDSKPSIREKAVRGLAALQPSKETERALIHLTSDMRTGVRTAAVGALSVGPATAAALLERVNDLEACVRAQLFSCFVVQPSALDALGAGSLGRLVVGLVDRAGPVRGAAGAAVDVWKARLGGALHLMCKCDVMADETLGEAIAGALVARYPEEASHVAREWLNGVGKNVKGSSQKHAAMVGSPPGVLMARFALVAMSDEDRDLLLDVPQLLKRAESALSAVPAVWKGDKTCKTGDFLLRQLLHIMTTVDVGDEAIRRDVEKLAEAVLLRAPIVTGDDAVGAASTARSGGRRPYSTMDLAVVLLRRCMGLASAVKVRTRKHQASECNFSKKMVLLMSDICQPYEGGGTAEEAGEGEVGSSFAGRLSRQLQKLNDACEERKKKKDALVSRKKTAIAAEDFIACHEIKGEVDKVEHELKVLQEKIDTLQCERDSVCLRVTAMITALLHWSCSELRWDPALFGTLQTILQPMVTLPALSEDVDIAAIAAICLFCTRDGTTARMHWSLFLQLVRNLREGSGSKRLIRARATVAARTLADCARLHSESVLDRDEVLGAALSLAAVPFHSRHIVIEPLCGWLLSLGHVFFEEHLLEPVLEVQWALGWMLVEAFRQRSHGDEKQGKPGEDADDQEEEDIDASMAMQLTQFFSLLPKLPGKQGAPMLSLAVEAVVESGLWRRAVLQPQAVGFHTRFVRSFSWPQLFAFAHERLPTEMRFRLWRCALQLCVMSPVLAPLAEVPMALQNAVAARQAPPGAAELIDEAIRLGADAAALASIGAKLPPLPDAGKGAQRQSWLLPRAEAEQAERAKRADLDNVGIADLALWAPAEVQVPEVTPTHLRMRQAPRRGPQMGKAGVAGPGMPVLQAGSAAPETPLRPPPSADATPMATPRVSVVAPEPAEMAAPPAPSVGKQRKQPRAQAKTTDTGDMPPPPAPEAKRRRANGKTAPAGNVQLPLSELGA
eukprot:TRINITY_DN121550_c0_g1_i1.p1 TRINITY_DN121550_c0_g1~~TRINITY_DN121550_c0_g1_i1.p1  ORF type:complete len:1137 (-),score=292.20 TRINITY_DN121550_c0_g1_i1:216-3572(-)